MLYQNDVVENHALKHRKLVFEFSITKSATAANKVHASDLPGVCFLRTEGKVADADAVEDLSGDFATADDESSGNSTFGVLLRGGASYLGQIKKVLKISVSESSTSVGTSYAITKLGTGGLSSGGNIAFDIVGTGLRLDTESPKMVVEVDYLLSE